ncbi:MAG: hypothetical protein WD851_02470 [Pirellulales bacterium]
MSAEPPPLETLALTCPHCGGAFQVRSEYRGLQVACPLCQQAIEVPVASGVVPPPPPQAQSQPLDRVAGVEPAGEPPPEARWGLADSTPATPVEVPAEPEPEPAPPRELTREERQRLRRRFRIAVAVLAAIVLAIALSLLLRVG